MAYIGNPPITGNFQVCDAISVVNGQAAYTMQVSSVNVSPESANHMLVSLNGILQKPNSSFTISGSTITFASNLATGDVIDFIIFLGNVLDLGVPSDATVTDAKANFVSTSSAAGLQIKGDGTTDGTLQLNCSQNSHGVKLKSPAHSAGQSYTLTLPATAPATDKMIQTNSSGVLSFVDAPSGSHTLLSTTTASNVANLDITSNINSTYKRYMIDIINAHPVTNDVEFRMRFFKSSSIEDASIYDYAFHRTGSNGTDTFVSSANASQIQLNTATAYHDFTGASSGTTKATLNGRILLFDPSNTGVETYCQYDITYHIDGDSLAHIQGAGRVEDNGAIDGLRFYFSSGNVEEGIFKLYGIS